MKLKILLVAVILLTLLAAPLLYAAENGAVIMSVAGDPKIMKKGAGTWVSCGADMAIETGDRVKTQAGEDIQIAFAQNSNFVKINENSDVMLLISKDGGSIDLMNGEALALIEKMPAGSTFEIKTPSGVSGARGTGWGARTDGARSTFNSFERSIYVKGIDRSGNAMKDELEVREGFGTLLNKFDRPERLEKLSAREIERWNGWRDALRERATRDRESGAKGPGSQGKESEKDKFEKVENSRDRMMERRESQKQDTMQNRDTQRMEQRMERREPRREPDDPNKLIDSPGR